MNVADFAVPLLAFGLVVNSVYAGLKTGFKRKEIIELVISFLMLGFSWWIASQNSDTFKSINEKNDLLKQDVSELLRQRRSDSADNFNFQKYLKDTFGIEKKGDTAIIVNNTVFIQQALVQKEDQTYTALPDSLNVNVNFKDNILRVSPKEGRWVSSFMAVDTSSHMHNSNMVDEGGGTAYAFDKIKVGNKEYYTNIINIWERPISLENPMRINLSNNPKQYVIFGEQATSKRYMFRNGRLIWIPN